IGAFLLVVMMVVTLITLRTPSRYVSTGRISVSRENPDVAGFKNGVSSADSDTDLTMLLETQVQVIRSRHQSANPWNRRFASRPAMPNTIPILVCSSCSRNRTRRRHSRISVGRRN
ncbi:MAG TPA: hypothetical protein VN622_03790, partial [Clostridia bacterium]|nr:hypothetical protein [Clostridia bacterium]